jgi:hypothetical protein
MISAKDAASMTDAAQDEIPALIGALVYQFLENVLEPLIVRRAKTGYRTLDLKGRIPDGFYDAIPESLYEVLHDSIEKAINTLGYRVVRDEYGFRPITYIAW